MSATNKTESEMKKLIIASVLAATFITPAMASDRMQEVNKAMEYCQRIGGIAGSFMRMRQNGWPMDAVIAEDIGRGVGSERFMMLMHALIIEAFGKPSYSSEEMKERAINDFQGEVTHECIQRRMETIR